LVSLSRLPLDLLVMDAQGQADLSLDNAVDEHMLCQKGRPVYVHPLQLQWDRDSRDFNQTGTALSLGFAWLCARNSAVSGFCALLCCSEYCLVGSGEHTGPLPCRFLAWSGLTSPDKCLSLGRPSRVSSDFIRRQRGCTSDTTLSIPARRLSEN
jgi:hypothetical protein